MIRPIDITGVILCGGKARRMKQRDKALELLDNTPIVARIRAALAPQVKQVIISANRHRERFAKWGDLVVSDTLADQGPLGGLWSALERVTTPYTFCCPGDAPFLSDHIVATLASALEAGDAELAIPHDGAREQHLFMLLRSDQRNSLRTVLDQGGRAVTDWTDRRRRVVVRLENDPMVFFNVNTEADLQYAAMLMVPTRS